MKSTRYMKCFFLVILLLGVNTSYAGTLEIDLLPFSKATYLASRGRHKQAAEQWHRLTQVFMRSEAKLGKQKMWQYAGLSEALAAIAADKANNAIAYQYWADSMRYLMTGGTNWEQVKESLNRRYKKADIQLSTLLQTNEFSPGINERWQKELATLQIWDEKLDLFSFESPKLGLNAHFSSEPVPTPAPSRTVYYAPSVPGKKLSGLKDSFPRGMHFMPMGPSQAEGGPGDTEGLSPGDEPSVGSQQESTEQTVIFETDVESIDRLIDADQVIIFPAEPQKTDSPSPLVRGSLATTEETNVEALRRRGVSPVSK